MKKTLLLTTALIGTLSILGSAQAEISVGGHVKLAYKSMEGLTTTAKSNSGFSQERQLDFKSSGALNNGWNYAAGFSLEQDGGETGFDGSETNYIQFIKGNTTIHIGADSAPLNGDYNIVPRAGNAMNEEIGYSSTQSTHNAFNTTLAFAQDATYDKAPTMIAVMQKFDGGAIAVGFAPRSDDKLNAPDTAVPTHTGKSVHYIAYAGKPVANLDVYAEYASQKKNSSDLQDGKVTGLGLAYTMGSVKVGAERVKYEALDKTEKEMTELGAVMKLSDNATAGIGRTQTEGKTANGAAEAAKEKVLYLQVGYNLGAVGTQVSIIDAENLGYVAASDSKAVVFKINTKF
jgi:hypothetical protein